MVPVIKVLKGKRFEWTKSVQKAFEVVKEKLTSAPILALPNFTKVFKVECDASWVGSHLRGKTYGLLQ